MPFRHSSWRSSHWHRTFSVAGIMLALPACASNPVPAGSTTPSVAKSSTQTIAASYRDENVNDSDAQCDAIKNAFMEDLRENSSEVYGSALYTPADSGGMFQLVTTENDCNDLQISCFRKCWKSKLPKNFEHIPKGSAQHHNFCTSKCRAVFMDCMKKAGLLQEFSALDVALAWLKKNSKAIIGTVVLVGGAVYIVSTAGSGALVLVLL